MSGFLDSPLSFTEKGKVDNAHTAAFHNDGTLSSQIGKQNISGSVYNTIQYNGVNGTKPESETDLAIERRRRIQASLSFDQIEARHATIRPAHAQTCQWILTRSEYHDWLDDAKLPEHHGLLWIKGKPATGKSTIVKFVFTMTKKQRQDSMVLVFFFNARGGELEKSTTGMYRSLILQLLKQQPGLQDIFDYFPLPESEQGVLSWSIETLVNLFNHMIEHLGERSVICFIDAIDECQEEQIRTMLQDLENLGRVAKTSGSRFRVCLSSRHFPHITVHKSISLILENQREHTKDIAQYLESELKIGTSQVALHIKQDLLNRAAGIFLWVVIVTRILNIQHDRGLGGLEKKLLSIPNDLESLFNDMLMREGHPEQELVICLRLLLFAMRPLSAEELYFAIRSMTNEIEEVAVWNIEEDNSPKIKRYLLNCSKGLIEQTTGEKPTMQFIHESVRDHFLTGNGLQSLNLGPIDTFEAQSHEIIKDYCHMHCNAVHHRYLHTLDKIVDVERFFPCLEYVVSNVLRHSNAACSYGIDQTNFINSFDLKKWKALCNLVCPQTPERTPHDVSLLYVLAEKGLASLISSQHTKGSYPQTAGNRYHCPFAIALARKDLDTLKALLSLGRAISPGHQIASPVRSITHEDICKAATMLLTDGYNGVRASVLSAAARKGNELLLTCLIDSACEKINDFKIALPRAAKSGHVRIVRLLLEIGVNVPKISRSYRDALAVASRYGHVEVIQMLLGAGVDVNAIGGRYGNALSSAIRGRHGEAYRLLLAAGADVNMRVYPLPSTLCYAAEYGSENGKVVSTLLDAGANVNDIVPDGLHEFHANALMRAARRGHEKVVLMLLKAGADVNAKGSRYGSAIAGAAACGHEKVCRMLLDAGADVNLNGGYYGSALGEVAACGNETITRMLLDAGADINAYGGHYGSALATAAYFCNKKVVRLLLDVGANVNVLGPQGSPLSLAQGDGSTGKEREEVVRMLIAAGAKSVY